MTDLEILKSNTKQRRVNVTYANYIADFDKINLKADLAVMTETIEHLPNPHGFLKKLFDETQIKYIVCSSPWNETELTSGGGHVWAWDREGYAKIITDAGWVIISHEDVVPRFQIVLAVRGK